MEVRSWSTRTQYFSEALALLVVREAGSQAGDFGQRKVPVGYRSLLKSSPKHPTDEHPSRVGHTALRGGISV